MGKAMKKYYEQPIIKTYESGEILEILGPAQGLGSGGAGGGNHTGFKCEGTGYSRHGMATFSQ
jgi:hypothetical protein